MRHSVVRMLAAVAVAWLGCGAAGAQTIVSVSPGIVTVRAEEVAIGAIMDQLARLSPLDRIELDPAWRAQPVTFVAERVSIREAMYLALKASGLDFVMAGGRLIAGRTKIGSAAPAADARREEGSRPPVIEVEEVEEVEDPPVDDHPALREPPADDFASLVKAPAVPFNVREDSVVVAQPGFVPFKLRPDVVRRRMLVNVADIP